MKHTIIIVLLCFNNAFCQSDTIVAVGFNALTDNGFYELRLDSETGINFVYYGEFIDGKFIGEWKGFGNKGIYQYSYDTTGLMLEKCVFDSDTNLLEKTSLFYSSNDQVALCHFVFVKGYLSHKSLSFIDSKGLDLYSWDFLSSMGESYNDFVKSISSTSYKTFSKNRFQVIIESTFITNSHPPIFAGQKVFYKSRRSMEQLFMIESNGKIHWYTNKSRVLRIFNRFVSLTYYSPNLNKQILVGGVLQ